MFKVAARLHRAIARLSGHRFYPVLVASIATTDYFIPGSPSNAVLVATVLPQPQQWRILGISFAIGCALGALALATLMYMLGDAPVAWVRQSEAADLWLNIETFVGRFGLFALFALAVSPAPVRIAVAVLALAGHAPLLLAGVVLSGRLLIYPAIAALAAFAPRYVLRWRFFTPAPALVQPTNRSNLTERKQ